MNEQLIKKINKESTKLKENLDRLNNFIESDNFQELSDSHKLLLEQQETYMRQYKTILGLRILLLKNENI